MIFELSTSPYIKSGYVINFREGDKGLYRKKIEYTPKADDNYHVTNDGDTLDGIAFNYYGESKLWWVIADVNNIENPLNLDSGLTLLVPKINNLPNV